MATYTTISSLAETLGTLYTGPAYAYGFDRLEAVINRDLGVYNMQTAEILNSIAQEIPTQTMVFDGTYSGYMTKVDEIGRARSQSESNYWDVSVAISKYSFMLGWTADYLRRAISSEVDKQFKNMQVAHQRTMLREFKKAIYGSTNLTVYDKFVDNKALSVKRFWNGDGVTPPPNTSGSTFLTTHTHYLASASMVTADVNNLVNTVIEHDNPRPTLVINRADVTAFSSLSGFRALGSPLMLYPAQAEPTQRLDLGQIDNRNIGLWNDQLFVCTRPWAIPNYITCLVEEGSDPKPVGYRQLLNPSMQGLQLNTENENNHLIANEGVVYLGFGVLNRGAGGILFTASGTWADPTL